MINDISIINALIYNLQKILSGSNENNISLIANCEYIEKLAKLIDADIPHLRMNLLKCLTKISAGSNEAVGNIINLGIETKILNLLNIREIDYLENV